MLYRYKSIEQETGEEKNGTIEAATLDIAVDALHRRKLIVISIVSADDTPIWEKILAAGKKVNNRDVVILSRQIATLFKAQVSALRVFQLLSLEVENDSLKRVLTEVAEDIQGGMSLSGALNKHSEVFTDFYVNMVRAGEESGNLSNTFGYMADYLERSYELIRKTKSALIYPAFVIVVFIVVIILMLVIVIPKLSVFILEANVDIPTYTKAVINASNFLINYGVYLAVVITAAGVLLWRWLQRPEGRAFFARVALTMPYLGDLYRKIYLARISDNLNTMLGSGIAMVRAVEISSSIVGNELYRSVLLEVANDVRTGVALSAAMSRHDIMPGILVQMIRVGEETGEVGNILETLATFYKREVDTAVETLIGLIEPAMIVMLGVGVGGLLASILMPIYDVATSI